MIERRVRFLIQSNSWRLVEKNFDGYQVLFRQYNMDDLTIFTDPVPTKIEPKQIPEEDLEIFKYLLDGSEPTTIEGKCLLDKLLAMDDN